ncbi:MAG: hypothetical protein WCG34_07615 [Leptolinea sp.]
MARLDDAEAKMQLPEAWGAKMACPVCGSRPLGVFHPTGQADRFVCQSCETSFELENNGTRVRFVTLPRGIAPWLRSQWVALEEALAAFTAHQNETFIIPPSVYHSATPVEAGGPKSVEKPAPELMEGKQPETETPAPEQPARVEPKVPAFMADFLSDKPAASEGIASPSTPSPFYEHDIDIPGIYIDRRKPENPENVGESWKEKEDRRVKNSQINPPVQEPVEEIRLEEKKPVNLDLEARLQGTFNSPANTDPQITLPLPVSSNRWVPEFPDLKNLPPVNKVEDTPPVPISFAQQASLNAVPEEDLGVLRGQIIGAGSAPTLPERMQAASKRALELERLGNTDNEVRSILERSSGLTPEQVGDVLKELVKPGERNRSGRLLIIFSILAIIIFSLLAWWFWSNWGGGAVDQQPGAAETETTSSLPGQIIDPKSLPPALQTLIPNGVRIFNDPVVVENTTADILPPAPCPKSKMEAAATFGGPANDWNAEKQNLGWMMLSQQQSLENKVPANMTASYLTVEADGPRMLPATGPAFVRNAYMVSISCE